MDSEKFEGETEGIHRWVYGGVFACKDQDVEVYCSEHLDVTNL